MTEHHSYSFFGENVAIIILTKDYNDKVHLNFIRKKDDNKWEKFEEGLHIELALDEICKILDFLEHNEKIMYIIHQHPESKHQKKFTFMKFKEKKTKRWALTIIGELLNDTIKKYEKTLTEEKLRLFKKIFEHLEMEKIAYQKT
ncbi:MAG: hypothetical protein ACTSRP_25830 [Candidatus Helarchaeota archaeon]